MAGSVKLGLTVMIEAIDAGAALVETRPKLLYRPPPPWEAAYWVLPSIVKIANGEGTFYATELGPRDFVHRHGWRVVEAFEDHIVLAANAIGGLVVVGVNPGGGGVRRLDYVSCDPTD